MKVNNISFFNSKKEVVISEDNGFEKPLDGSKLYNVKPPFYVIDFTSSNQDGIVAWSEDNMEATFTHTLNCYPVVTVYDSNGELSQPVVTVLSGNSFKLSFCENNAVGNESWHCVINYGGAYGEGNASFSSQITSLMNDLAEYMALATEMNKIIQELNVDSKEY